MKGDLSRTELLVWQINYSRGWKTEKYWVDKLSATYGDNGFVY